MYDICIIGPITKDIIVTKEKVVQKTGGVVYYSSLTAKKFNLKVCVITKTKEEDKYLIEELKEKGIDVFWKESKGTMTFKNIYKENVDERIQEVTEISDPFDIKDINVKAKIYYFGPLLNTDIPLEIYEKIKREDNIVVLDIQGHLRHLEGSRVVLRPLKDLSFLEYIDILKTNEEEIRILSGEKDIIEGGKKIAKYVKELLITLGSKGSIIISENKVYKIPVFKPRKITDPTGSGDIYTATYVCMRYKGFPIESSGLFASILSGLNVEKEGFNVPIEIEF